MQRVTLQRTVFIDEQVGDAGDQRDDEGNRDQGHKAGEFETARLSARHAIERQLHGVRGRGGEGGEGERTRAQAKEVSSALCAHIIDSVCRSTADDIAQRRVPHHEIRCRNLKGPGEAVIVDFLFNTTRPRPCCEADGFSRPLHRPGDNDVRHSKGCE